MTKKPKKSLGQNYLIDNNILKLISAAGNVSSQNDIMEIGPGTGKLTEYLCDLNYNKFVAIEKDNKGRTIAIFILPKAVWQSLSICKIAPRK